MAALLVSIAVMSVLMTAILPAWRQQAQREKEAELAFRGEQYARAIYLYQAKFRTAPPSLDVLVQQKFLRKKYKDPMTKDGEFQLLYIGANTQPGMPQTGQAGQVGTSPFPGRAGQPQMQSPSRDPRSGQPGGVVGGVSGGGPVGGISGGGMAGGGIALGGIMGVQSKSKDASIRIYHGASHYNEWRFVYNAQGRGGPGQQGVPGIGPGGQPFPGAPGFPGRGPRGGRGFGPGGGMGPGGGRGGRGMGRGPGGFGPQPVVR